MSTQFKYDALKQLGIIDSSHLTDVREYFSVKNEAAVFARNRFIPNRKYAITPTGRFDPCLFLEIYKYIHSKYTDVILVDKSLTDCVRPSSVSWFSVDKIREKPFYKLSLDLRDYQQEAIDKCYEYGRGVVKIATAGGKTLTMARLLTDAYSVKNDIKACIMVPNIGLVSQTYKDFIEYKVPFRFNRWTGNNDLDLNTNIIIANTSIILSKKSDISWMEDIDIFVMDEVHGARHGNEINKVLKKIKTPHKFGFTGTLPENKLDQWNIIGKIGPLIYEKTSTELQKEKHIAPCEAVLLELNYKNPPVLKTSVSFTDKYRHEMDFIATNKFRSSIISKLMNKIDKNCLILIDFINHGETLTDYLKENCPTKKVYFIRGSVEVEDRDKVKALMEKQNNIICVAVSKIFSTGINIKNIHYIVFAGGGKAKIKTLQSIGRGLRLHDTKEKLIIFDIADILYYGKQHLQKRIRLYTGESISMSRKEFFEL